MANLPKRTPEKDVVILDALREKPTYASAARKARISRRTLYEWRKEDPEFDAACIAARNEGLDALEDKLIERGMKNDTTAAIFMLKSLRRETYGDKVQHSGEVGTVVIREIHIPKPEDVG
jgi:uncharacterized linocin/CFP29 family protein